MKRYVMVILLGLFLLLGGCAGTSEQKAPFAEDSFVKQIPTYRGSWIWFGRAGRTNWYYHLKSVTRSSGNVFGVRVAFSDPEYRSLQGYKNYAYTLQEYKIDCSWKKWAAQSAVHYDNVGGIIARNTPALSWSGILSGTPPDELYRMLCRDR